MNSTTEPADQIHLTAYKKRPIRFMEIIRHEDWQIKLYSVSEKNKLVSMQSVEYAKYYLTGWLSNSKYYPLTTYRIATLILHEGKEGCFAIINWWIDENMLQQFVYLATPAYPSEFKLLSDKGIITCVWEMAVLWFERNAWVKHVLEKSTNPDFEAYLAENLNEDV
jgi:hypothetical protein